MKSLIEQLANPSLIGKCLYDVKPQIDIQTGYQRKWTNLFQTQADWIDDCCQQLLTGKFRFGAPKYVNFKNSRPLLVIGPLDRAIEQAILAVIKNEVMPFIAFKNTYARLPFGEEEPKSLQDLARSISSIRLTKPYVFETDIKKFFPSVNHSKLCELLDSILSDGSLNSLLLQIVRRQPPDIEKVPVDQQWYFKEIDRSVPQGSCLSPILSYIYLIPFDSYLEEHGVEYRRYVDDLVVFTNSEEEAQSIEKAVHKVLGTLNLKAHHSNVDSDDKGHILGPDEPLSFVGFDFLPPDIVRPRKKAIKRFESRIAEICVESKNLRELLNKLHNFTTGWMAAYAGCDLPKALRERLDEHQLASVRGWLETRGTLARSYHNYPKRSQAIHLGLNLLKSNSKEAIEMPNEVDLLISNLTADEFSMEAQGYDE